MLRYPSIGTTLVVEMASEAGRHSFAFVRIELRGDANVRVSQSSGGRLNVTMGVDGRAEFFLESVGWFTVLDAMLA